MDVPIIRRGSGKCNVTVHWETENVNIAQQNYEQQSGSVELAAGAFEVNIPIRIRDDESWSLETKQYVFITKVESKGEVECKIGDLKRGTIVILNDDAFPMGCDPNKKTEDGELVHGENAIVKAFATHLWQSLHYEGTMGMIYKIYPSLHWVMTQLLMLLSINLAFKDYAADENTANFRTIMYSLAGAYVVSLGLWMLASWEYIELRLGGKSKMILKKACVGTMLQLTEEANNEFPPGTVLSVTNAGVDNAIKLCWTGMFGMWDECVSFVVVTAFTAYVIRKTPYLLLIPVVQLACDYVVYYYRSPETITKQTLAIIKDDEVQRSLTDVCDMRDLVTMYKASGQIIPEFAKNIGGHNKSLWQADRYASDTAKIFKALHAIFILACFIGGGELHHDDPSNFKVGNFVALMGIIFKYDKLVTSFFANLDDQQTGYTYVKRVANLLNADTRRKQSLRFDDDMKTAIQKCGLSDFVIVDDITLNRVVYEYEEVWGNKKMGKVIGPFSFSVEQGQVLAISGPAHQSATGTKTLLRMIARQMQPTAGFILYPGNLRVRYMPAVPIVWAGGIMYNLRFGNMNKAKDAQYTDDQVWEVYTLLGGNEKYLRKDDADVSHFSDADRNICAITRCVLSDVDMLLLGNSMDCLGEAACLKIMSVVRQWIVDRGLPAIQPKDKPLGTGKKKTFIMTTKHVFLTNQTDGIMKLE